MKLVKIFMTKLSRSVSKFSRWDWMVFEIALMMFSLLLAKAIPSLITGVPVWVYFVLFILPYTYLLRDFFSKANKISTENIVKKFSHLASNFEVFDWAAYKVCIFGFSLMFASWVPVLLELHWVIYIVVVLVLSLYFFAHIFSEK
jgi:hypothetical protein